MLQFALPISQINKGSRIALYGAGKYGRKFYEDNKRLNWCEIILFVDNKQNLDTLLDVPVIQPSELSRFYFDKLVIANSILSVRKEIRNELISMGIPPEKIIYRYDCIMSPGDTVLDDINYNVTEPRAAVILQGALGDNVIFRNLYENLTSKVPFPVDIFSDNFSFTRHIFLGCRNLGVIYQLSEYTEDKKREYCVVFKATLPLIVDYCKTACLRQMFPETYDFVMKIYDYQMEERFDYPDHHVSDRIVLDKARLTGADVYTLHNWTGVLDIREKKVELSIGREAYDNFHELQLPERYITFSYDAAQIGKTIQTKVWPKEYYINLIAILHDKYPDIKIIQIDGGKAERIDAADRNIMGEDLETVKLILKKALLHIDNEGGLVHVASQLGTKCVVLFGPTPVDFYGYEQNCNITSLICGDCMAVTREWNVKCTRFNKAECMYSITPELVENHINKILRDKEE